MSVPPRKKRQPVERPAQPDLFGLRLSEPALRLRAAQEAREALLVKVNRRKAALEVAEREAREAMQRVANRVAPKIDELRAFDQEIHDLLDALAADSGRNKRERNEINRIHRDLQRRGVLSPRAAARSDGDHWPNPDDYEDFLSADDGAEAASAPRAKESEHGGLRATFRRMVEAFHPDKVQDEAEKAVRTEVMKDITAAYQRGDFAQLIEIERRWQRDQSHGDGNDDFSRAQRDAAEGQADLEDRYLAVERSNEELRAQLREIEREVRAVRRSPHGQLAHTLKRAGRDGLDESNLDVVQEIEGAAAELRSMRDFVISFRDRKISFTQFRRGPIPVDSGPGQDDYDEFLDAITALANEMMAHEQARTRPKSPRRRR